jgi:predicted patatin/cPLA2 family phospholipase
LGLSKINIFVILYFISIKAMTIDNNTGLVLEGGGLRGVFTCGVLDCFMDHGIRFPFAVGVSAGACNGLSYMSGQRGRAKSSNIDLMDKHHYIGFKYLLTQRNIMDFKLLFEDFPERIIPYDYDAYFSNPARFVMVTTNCLTGKAEYFEEKSSSKRVMDIVRASSSLPFVSPITYVDGVPMLDGGIVDSIPVRYALSQGYERLVVILTRNKGYRKQNSEMRAAKVFYRKYPNLQKALSQRNAVYNQTMDLIERLEDEGRITVIRPIRPVEVGRMEKDTAKLTMLYQEGYDIARSLIACENA